MTLPHSDGFAAWSAEEDLEKAELRVNQLRVAATLYRRRDRGPMRPVGRRGGARPGGLYWSQKMGAMVGWESKEERKGFFCCEVDTDVERYWSQPHTIEGVIGGKLRRYTPDREDLLADGTVRIVEVKDEFKAEKYPDYDLKLEYFASVYRAVGWVFCVTDRTDLPPEPAWSAIERVQAHRRALITAGDLRRVREAAARKQVCLADVVDALGGGPIGEAKACAMMVARYVAIDLSNGLVGHADVRLV